MNDKHPYVNYGTALINLASGSDNLSVENLNRYIEEEIQIETTSFRVIPNESFESKEQVKYIYEGIEKGIPDKGVFLSPCI